MNVIDLFCGCGGFSLGFTKEGFNVLGIDIWDVALQSHGGNTILYDITQLQQHHLPHNFQHPDIIIGSPPCQTFSTANRHTRTKDDTLIKEFNRLVDQLKPQYWIWENVMGSRYVQKGVTIDAQKFGIAQRRKRNFVSNFSLDETVLQPYYCEPKCVKDVLLNIKGSGLLDGYNSKIYSLDTVSPTIRRIPLKWYDGRYDKTGIPKPLRFTGFEMLTIEEHLILMGFPNNYKLYGTKTNKMLQIGNAVSPNVSHSIAQILKNC